MITLTDAEEARFWEKIQKLGQQECWPWTAKSRHRFGYGVFSITRDKRARQFTASRVACWLEHGPPPFPSANALHSCDNPICCNPAHLRWGSQKANVDDAIERKRASKPPQNYSGRHTGKMPKGASVWNQTLSEDKVREIWRLHLAGGMTTGQIAEAVGAKQHAVADVTRGRSWRHLEGAPSIAELKSGGVRRGYNQFTLPQGNAREVGFSGA
jgi:hypothetical protein